MAGGSNGSHDVGILRAYRNDSHRLRNSGLSGPEAVLMAQNKDSAQPAIYLRRKPGTCCPEPSCDYVGTRTHCDMCGQDCEKCLINKTCRDVPAISL